MVTDVGKYHNQIGEFVNELCHIYYRHSQPEDRIDIRNEVALIAHQNREKVVGKDEPAFLAWLHEIARNVIRNWSRREGRLAKHSLGSLNDDGFGQGVGHQIESNAPLPEKSVLAQERAQVIRGAIAELSVIHQQVVWLFYVEELPEGKIAKQLGIKKGTVKSRLHNARNHLAGLLAPYMKEEVKSEA